MKILSISDVITNSSSEVFVYFDKTSEKKLKELVDVILATFNVPKTFDDLFTIEYELSDEAEDYSVEEALSEGVGDYGPLIESYKVVPKERGHYEYPCKKLLDLTNMFDYEYLCKKLSDLINMFNYEEVYN